MFIDNAKANRLSGCDQGHRWTQMPWKELNLEWTMSQTRSHPAAPHPGPTWEVGFEFHPQHKWFGSSPDGVVHWPSRFPNNPWGALEIKCCTKKNNRGQSVPHDGVPYYYIPQLHAGWPVCLCPACRWTLFVSWSQTKSKLYIVKFDGEFVMWDMVVDFRAETLITTSGCPNRLRKTLL